MQTTLPVSFKPAHSIVFWLTDTHSPSSFISIIILSIPFILFSLLRLTVIIFITSLILSISSFDWLGPKYFTSACQEDQGSFKRRKVTFSVPQESFFMFLFTFLCICHKSSFFRFPTVHFKVSPIVIWKHLWRNMALAKAWWQFGGKQILMLETFHLVLAFLAKKFL